jgi:hypothetical protein
MTHAHRYWCNVPPPEVKSAAASLNPKGTGFRLTDAKLMVTQRIYVGPRRSNSSNSRGRGVSSYSTRRGVGISGSNRGGSAAGAAAGAATGAAAAAGGGGRHGRGGGQFGGRSGTSSWGRGSSWRRWRRGGDSRTAIPPILPAGVQLEVPSEGLMESRMAYGSRKVREVLVGPAIPCSCETDIFHAVGLAYVPPHMRNMTAATASRETGGADAAPPQQQQQQQSEQQRPTPAL